MIHKARKAVRDMAARGISSSGPGMRTGMTMEGKTDRSRDSEVSKSALLYIPSGDVCRATLQVAGEAVIRMPVSLRSLRLRKRGQPLSLRCSYPLKHGSAMN